MNTEFIQLKGVTKAFKKNLVLDNIDLSIPERQITGIVGASGEGKTTILKLLIGFYKPTKGDVLYLKRDVLKDLKNIRKVFGFATEDGSFYEDLTVYENIFHFGTLHKMKKGELKARAGEILRLLELEGASKTKAKDLSVGMKKRLDVACSIIHRPTVLIMDEPTADLDPLLRGEMLALIKKIKKQGTTIILTTQLLGEMDRICDRVAILHKKKIIEEGTPAEIRAKYGADTLNKVFEKIFSKTSQEKSESEKKNPILEKPQAKPLEKPQMKLPEKLQPKQSVKEPPARPSGYYKRDDFDSSYVSPGGKYE